jgi:hypothetical protein
MQSKLPSPSAGRRLRIPYGRFRLDMDKRLDLDVRAA